MIVLFTDFGLEGPYMGQMQAVLAQRVPNIPVITLFADAPVQQPALASYLLAAYASEFPPGTVFLCVVDPGVGTDRPAALVQADGRWYVSPDNGLLNMAARRAQHLEWYEITWRPDHLSVTFHGRDLFAPVAAEVACGRIPQAAQVEAEEKLSGDWPDDLPRVIYVDHYGNAMTGMRAQTLSPTFELEIKGHRILHARVFADVSPGEGFWYENANGLVEIAVNQGRASDRFRLDVGDAVSVLQR